MARTGKKNASANSQQIGNMDKIRIGVAEIIGTGMLVFIGCMGCMTSIAGAIPIEQIAFTFGLAVMFIVQIFGHISGAHLNPAVTIAAVILEYVPYTLAPIYFISQMIGGILGFALLKSVTPSNLFNLRSETINAETNETIYGPGVCSTIPNEQISSLQALCVETVISLVLILVCCAVWDPRNSNKHDSVSIRFGLTIAGLAMAAAPYTGGSMNPARSFAPALLNNDWTQHWVYWFGPLLAAVVGAGGYKALFSYKEPESEANETEDIPLNVTSNDKANTSA